MKIKVINSDGKLHTVCCNGNDSESLLTILCEHQIYIPAPCGGKGNCGHCQIQLIAGRLEITEKDRQHLSTDKLNNGYRLACTAYPREDLTIRLPRTEIHAVSANSKSISEMTADSEYIIAADLGTTTLAFALVDIKSHKIIQKKTATNPQNSFGADVMSRMEASNSGSKMQLAVCIRQALQQNISSLVNTISSSRLKQILISGNTAMVHLLMGYSCISLSKYPFVPVTLEEIHSTARELNILDENIPVTITKGLSSFVGGDIFSGLQYLKYRYASSLTGPWIFIDLGTNAEMVLSNAQGNLFISSAPAGPAFEAANISCGTAAVDGAINRISIQKEKISYTTISGISPVGLCGSGLIEIIYELLKNHIIDSTGLLSDQYFENGYPILTGNEGALILKQKDIRAYQMAKSAVSSAIQILLEKSGLENDDIATVFLAGGFGTYLNLEKAAGTGLFPESWLPKIILTGNSSLKGAIARSLGKIPEENGNKVKLHEIILSNEESFTGNYYQNMYFPKF